MSSEKYESEVYMNLKSGGRRKRESVSTLKVDVSELYFISFNTMLKSLAAIIEFFRNLQKNYLAILHCDLETLFLLIPYMNNTSVLNAII